jgi:hypothetical protein
MLPILMLLTCLLSYAQERSLWVWSQDQYVGGSVATDAKEQKNLLRFIKENEIKKIYLESSRLFVTPKRIKSLGETIQKLQDQQVKTELLFGSTTWLDEEKSIEIKSWFDNVVFPQIMEFKSIPDAIHLDIEPHARDDWRENKQVLIERWLNLVQFISNLAHQNGIKITVDIPFFMDEETLLKLNDLVDSVVVMSYRTKMDGGNGIASLTEEERIIFKNKLTIGLETGSDDPLLSFGQDAVELNKVMIQIDNSFKLNVAIHHYESVKNLKLSANSTIIPN